VSVGAFVPKAFTPFQWEAMEDVDSLRSKIDLLRRRVHRGPSHLKWHDPGASVVEALLARGDRSVGRALRRAWELGARFDGWSEHFSLERWLQACAETGVDVGFQLRRRDPGETLPWDHLDMGILRPFLLREREAAMSGRVTEDCRWGACVACGIEGSGRDIVLTGNADAVPYGDAKEGGASGRGDRRTRAPARDPRATSGRLPSERIRVRFRYEKGIEARYLSHLDVARALERALRTAGAPLAFTEGFTPRPRVSYGPPLPVGVMGANEVLDVELRERARLKDLAARMNAGLPGGIRVHSADYIPFLAPAAAAALTEADYEAAPAPALALDHGSARSAIAAFERAAAFPLTRRSPKGEKTLDARKIVAAIAAEESGGSLRLRLTLRTEGAGLGPRLVLQGILGLGEQDSHLLRITRTNLRPASA
jgi:radical SAM-linked protein